MSARRFGGEHSPGGPVAPPGAGGGMRFSGRRAMRVNVGARLLWLAPVPMALAGVLEVAQGDAGGMLAELGSAAVLALGALLTSEGVKAQMAYDERLAAAAPALPRKALGAVATGLGVALGAGPGAGTPLIGAVVFGIVAAGLHIVAFGLDPLRAKGGGPADRAAAERAARAVDRAEETIAEILEAVRGTRDRALVDRVERMLGPVREVLRAVERDPADLGRARRFLGVYLVGARDAARGYAGIRDRDDGTARAEFEALLGDMEASFSRHREELGRNDRTALDVEIEVLRERLKHEGL